LLLRKGRCAGPELAQPGSRLRCSSGPDFRQGARELRSSVLRFGPDQLGARQLDRQAPTVPLGSRVPLRGSGGWSGLSAVGGVRARRTLRPVAAARGAAIGWPSLTSSPDGSRPWQQASRTVPGWLLPPPNLDSLSAPAPGLSSRLVWLSFRRIEKTGRLAGAAPPTPVPAKVIDTSGEGAAPAGLPTGGQNAVSSSGTYSAGLTPYWARWQEGPPAGAW